MNPVVLAHDRVEALAQLRADQAAPQLILLDLDLPHAVDLLREIRASERTRTTPVVALGTKRDAHAVSEAYAAGANSYVGKPLAFADFAEIMRHLGMYWLVLNRRPDQQRKDRDAPQR
jgi:two-component system response regulator